MSTDPTALPFPPDDEDATTDSAASDRAASDRAASDSAASDGPGPDDGLDDGLTDDELDDEVDPRHLAPLVVDATALHSHVDALTAALHRYVDLAVGARAEFDAATVEDDPRIEAAEEEIGRLNSRLSEAFETELGLVSGHTTEAWESDDVDDEDLDGEEGTLLEMALTVSPGLRSDEDDPMEHALVLVEEAAERLTSVLEDAGFTVDGWSVSRELDLDDEDD